MGELGGTYTTTGGKLSYLPKDEIDRLLSLVTDKTKRVELFATINRLNTLYMVMKAGSGHLGSSFSAMDIVAWLWSTELHYPNDHTSEYADIYFSSKGHDAPGLYATLIALGKLPFDLIHQLRRLYGLPGHPDMHTPHIATNTGSLGMGISKARGMALARRMQNKKGRIYVLTGDGELQEGQFWESLQPTVNAKLSEITVIIDHNKIQSDMLVKHVSDLGDLENKLRSFGWEVARINGHDIHELSSTVARMKTITDRPQIIIADTVKGKGVSFMERIGDDGYYKFHSGAPSLEDYTRAVRELLERITAQSGNVPNPVSVPLPVRPVQQAPQRLVPAYAKELLALATQNKKIVALDADLVLDTGLIPLKQALPAQYVEAGIAEQDMVSMAGGMALEGVTPVVHSFACFLSTRPNEQIYNNASEAQKVIYTASLAGLLPATPGHSHQSVRDISTVGAIPGLTLLEPSCEEEAQQAIRWAVKENALSTYIRLTSIPVEVPFALPSGYRLERGKGVQIHPGTDVLVIGYGPVLLSEAYRAAQTLITRNLSCAVVNLPWLNFVDTTWLAQTVRQYSHVLVLDNHYTTFGQGSLVGEALATIGFTGAFTHIGLDEPPQCGANDEVLRYHGLDAKSLARRVEEFVTR